MNFEFSDDDRQVQSQARELLAERIKTPRHAHQDPAKPDYDRGLWREVAGLGWLGCAVPDADGGAGLGYDALALLLEEAGAALAPIPFASTVMAIELLHRFGDKVLRDDLLGRLIRGAAVGCVHVPASGPEQGRLSFRKGKLEGDALSVLDGAFADVGVVMARDAGGKAVWVVVDLGQAGVSRAADTHTEPWRGHATVRFSGADAVALSRGDPAAASEGLYRLAVLLAWEQIGAARACLDQACNYARERIAFGRQIGSFQAVKHRLADVYVELEIARSHAQAGLCALADDEVDLAPIAAATRIAAGRAQQRAARDSFLTHGGMGYTWEADCHRYIRRAITLKSALATEEYWRESLAMRLAAAAERREASHGPV